MNPEKFNKESDFCEAVCKLIKGIFIGTQRKNVVFIPEVPIGYFSNEQVDMLMLDVKNLEYLCIEFKLKDYMGLKFQVHKILGNGLPAVGIINSKPQKNHQGDDFYDYLPEEHKIFSYTGLDEELNLLGSTKEGLLYPHRWRTIHRNAGMTYYWAYRYEKDNFCGGITSGNRDGFAKIYKQAIVNLHLYYGKLDFMITHNVLNSGYSSATSKKYYNEAITK